MTELLPCPFCGKEPWGTFGPREDGVTCWVECWGGSPDSCCGSWHFEGTREETNAAWNRRASPSPIAPTPTKEIP